ncbi:hypothetical protein FKM82_000875 [Ascaphus truei]
MPLYLSPSSSSIPLPPKPSPLIRCRLLLSSAALICLNLPAESWDCLNHAGVGLFDFPVPARLGHLSGPSVSPCLLQDGVCFAGSTSFLLTSFRAAAILDPAFS